MKYLMILFFCPTFLLSQNITIQGFVNDENGNKLVGASVIALRTQDSKIVSYSISDTSGIYKWLVAKSLSDSVLIKVSYLGKITQQRLFPVKASIDFNWNLMPSSENLSEVIIRARPVEISGDTIEYFTRSFIDEDDRVLSDLLKKIPGISISKSGSISFEGEPINRFYIEGLNLLNGKYNIATQSLTVDQVSSIQVLRNHQPKRVLKDIELSDKAALNIKLSNKFSGAVNSVVGGGLNRNEILRDISLTPLLFNKRLQSISSGKHNNTGITLKEIENDHFDFLHTEKHLLDETAPVLDIIEPDDPPFNSDRWIINNSSYISSRQLIKIKNEYNTLQGSFSYSRDKSFVSGRKSRFIDLANNIEAVTNESYDNNEEYRNVNLGLKYESNTKTSFFSTNTSYSSYSVNKLGLLRVNSMDIEQSLNTPSKEIENSTELIVPVANNKVLRLASEINYRRDREMLSIDSLGNQFRNTKVLGGSFEGSTLFKYRALKLKPLLRLDYQNNSLFSENDSLLSSNDISISYLNYSFGVKTEISLSGFVGSVEIPIHHYNVIATNNLSERASEERPLAILPKVGIKYDINNHIEFSANYGLFKRVYSIDKYANENIMINYRTNERYDESIKIYDESNVNVSLKYSNPINLIFASVGLSHSRKRSPFIVQSAITPTGFIDNFSVNQQTIQLNRLYSFLFSKKFIDLKTYVSFNMNFISGETPIVINQGDEEILKNLGISSTLNFDVNLSRKIDFLLGTKLLNFRTLSDNRNLATVYNFELLPSMSFTLSKTLNLKLKAQIAKQSFESNSNRFHFVDAQLSYTSANKSWIIDMSCQNITNVGSYTEAFHNSFSLLNESRLIRPRQILIHITRSF